MEPCMERKLSPLSIEGDLRAAQQLAGILHCLVLLQTRLWGFPGEELVLPLPS